MRHSHSAVLLTAIAIVVPQVNAEDGGSIGTPLLGLIYDSVREQVRPVLGTPGAAIAGRGTAVRFTTAVTSGNILLGVSAHDGAVHAIRWRGETPEPRMVSSALAGVDQVVLSPAGTVGLLCNSRTGVLQIVSGLTDLPLAGAELQMPDSSGIDGRKLAVSDDGSRVAIGSDTSVWLLESDGKLAAISMPAVVSALVFPPGRIEVVVLLKNGKLIRLGVGGAEDLGVIEGISGLDATGLQVSADGKRIFAAFSSGRLVIAESGAARVSFAACDCVTAGLFPSNRPGLYRLNQGSDKPLLFWDVSGRAPQVWFVPDGSVGDEQ